MPDTSTQTPKDTIAAGLPHPNAQYALAEAQENYVRCLNAVKTANEALDVAVTDLAHAKGMFYGRQPVVTGIVQAIDFEPHVAHAAVRAPQDAADEKAETGTDPNNAAGTDGNALRSVAAQFAANPVFVNADEVREQSTEEDPTGDKARLGGEATQSEATVQDATSS